VVLNTATAAMTTMTSAVKPARKSMTLLFAPAGAFFLPAFTEPLPDRVLRATKTPRKSMPLACGTITVSMEKGQDRFSAVGGLLSSSYATLASRIVLGGVFLVAGATKIPAPGALAAAIRSYELPLPEWVVSLSAHALPYLEVLLGLYLLAGLFTKISAWATNGLTLLFLLALLQGVVRGLEIDCGCFGSSAGETSNLWLAAARDVGLLALGLHVALAPLGRFSVDALLRRGRSEGEPYRA
jgi:putative oxidoreductase